ncbi:DUF6266 family protein [Pedobacter sp. GR22-6]|uniref:DUF6266 family protein n=1 Tax=Pedobacter sp. GR22-6 TaxID=3127957 RepID=UPI00307D288A
MGILDDGLFGGFRGKAGALVGRKVNGQSVITALHRKRGRMNRESLPPQVRALPMMVSFLSPLRALIAVGFHKYKKYQSPFNSAVGYNLSRAITYIGTEPYIDCSKLCYSKGTVATNFCTVIMMDEGGELVFSWNSGTQADQMDLGTFLVYDDDAQLFYVKRDAARRHEGMYFFALPPGLAGHRLHGYMSYTASEGKGQSDTMYASYVIV